MTNDQGLDSTLASRIMLDGRIRQAPALSAGIAVLGFIVALAILAPFVTFYAPDQQHVTDMLLGPSAQHWLGTDELGRDVWSRVVYGARIDLLIASATVFCSFIIGATLGLISGYVGGVLDTIIMRCVDFVMAFPFYVLIIALVFVLGTGITSMLVALIAVGWVSYARIVRGEVRLAVTKDYVAAARMTGLSGKRVLFVHILPNVTSQAAVYAMSDMLNVILAIVTLGFLGLGVQPPTPEWGAMIGEGSAFLTTQWGLATFPAIAVVITGLALSLIGDGIADLLHGE